MYMNGAHLHECGATCIVRAGKSVKRRTHSVNLQRFPAVSVCVWVEQAFYIVGHVVLRVFVRAAA